VGVEAWLTLLQAAAPASRQWLELLKSRGTPEAVLAESNAALLARGLPQAAVDRLKTPDEPLLERWRTWLEGPRRALVTFGSQHYPPRLAEIASAPLALWALGNLELLAGPQLAMVGSRNPTTSGRETAEQFAKYLGERGLTITSGLAVGIDAASHRGAVNEVGRTIAVLGNGIDAIYPRVHDALAATIAERGLLVSEYGPGVEMQKHFFPQRNRIIAGLSAGTLVVEATRRSGSLITAKCALDYGREVFAIPGSIHNPLARGCHWLIRQGAKLVEEAADIFIELAPQLSLDATAVERVEARPSAAETSAACADPSYQKLLQVLDFAPVSISALSERSQLTTAELSSMLLVLELEGMVEALPGGRYSRLRKRD
jgi:DNA processing protein